MRATIAWISLVLFAVILALLLIGPHLSDHITDAYFRH